MEPAMASKKISFLFLISLYFAGDATKTLAARRLLDTPVVKFPPLPSIPALPKFAFPPLPKIPNFPKPDFPPVIAGANPFPLSPSNCPPLPKVPIFPKPEVPPFPRAIPPEIAGVLPPLRKAPNFTKPAITGVPEFPNPFTFSPPATKSITEQANATLPSPSPEAAKPSISPSALPALAPTKINEIE